MIGNDVLDRFDERRHLRRRIFDSLAIVFNGILMLAFAALVSLSLIAEPRNLERHPAQMSTASPPPPAEKLERSARPAKIQTSNEPVSTVPEDSTSTQAPTIGQVAPIEPAEPSGPTSNQTGEGQPAGTEKPNQALADNVPMPVARPNPARSKKSDETANKNQNHAAKQDDHGKTEQANDQSGKKAIEPATSELDARRTLALDMERSYISSGVTDISTHVSGLNGTILNIEYPNLNDALVQKIMGVNSFAALLQKAGFTKIIFKGSQNKAWTIPLEKPSGPDTASQGTASKKPIP
jgi:hypothetical protein